MPTTSFSVGDITTLNNDLRSIDLGGSNSATNTNYTISLTADIDLKTANVVTELLAINLAAGDTLTIEGNNQVLDGANATNGLFVYAGTVTVDDLTIQNMVAQGGAGGGGSGAADGGGGGGAGLGGGLFVAGTNAGLASGGNVTLDNVTFLNDAAKGGNGGNAGAAPAPADVGGGGGLDGGAGGSGSHGGGGGGIGGNASGGSGSSGNGGPGIVPGAAGGGSGVIGGIGGASGGGGASFDGTPGAGGGIGGSVGTGTAVGFEAATGGRGGFGGGGGGASSLGAGGAGSFGGGGGGASFSGGRGGFGGGGGGGKAILHSGGQGGFGGGAGGGAPAVTSGGAGLITLGGTGGGGGLGAGGDIFVQQGGTLTIEGGTLSGGSVTRGTGGLGGATDGQAYGSGIFIQGNQSVVFAPPSGQTLTIDDVIADMTGSSDPSKQTGAGAVLATGGGTVQLMAHNTFSGGVTISGGATVELAFSDSAGVAQGFGSPAGTIVFGAGANTVQFDAAPTLPNNVMDTGIFDIAVGDTIDLRDLTFVPGASAQDSAGALTVTSGAVTWGMAVFGTATTFAAVSDGHGGTDLITGPDLALGTSVASWTEEGPVTTLSPTVTVTDPNSLDLVSATVRITGGTFAGDGDVLAATGNGTIAVSYNSTTETLTLTGSDTLADYQNVLDSVTFTTPSHNPTDYGSDPTRLVTWVINDGSGSFSLSTAQTETVSITAVNDPPTLNSVATSAHFTEGTAVTLSGAVSVIDVDSLDLAGATVAVAGGTFAGDGDVLAATGTATIAVSYNSTTETLTLTGSDTLAHYQAVLDTVTFNAGENPNDFGSNPTRTVVWTLNDGGGTANGGVQVSTPVTSTIGITNVNDPPTLGNVATSQNFTEEAGPVTLSSAVSVSDPDDLDLSSATVKIAGGTFTNDQDVLAANTSGTSIAASYNSSTETLTLTGLDTLAHYQTVLDSVTFNAGENPNDYGSNPTRTVTWTLMDPSGTLNGGVNVSTPVTSTVSITNVNDPPTLSGVATTVSVRAAAPTVTVSPNVTVSDPDNLTLAGATVSITGGTFSGDGDVLAATTTGTSIAASYNSTTETLTLTGSDTLAHYQQVLDSVTFDSTSMNPTNSGADKTRTLSWVVNDGAGSNNLSTPATTTISFASAVPYDFNGDGKSDLLFQNTNATPQIWLMNGTSVISQTSLPDPPVQWKIVGSGDFNGDGDADILWINTASNQPAIWEMNGTSIIGAVGLPAPPPSWRIAGIGDFYGTGDADILWQNTNGPVTLWEMNGTSIVNNTPLTTPPPGLKVVATGDFNGDGHADILFINTLTNAPTIWEMNGTSIIGQATLAAPPPQWEIVGTGDFNGDGDADILWLNTVSNQASIWEMNGTSVISAVALPAPPPVWKLIGTSDVNGDGKSDLLWQNTVDGTVTVWEMNGTSIAANIPVGTPGAGWQLNNNDPPLPAATPPGASGTPNGNGGTMHLSAPDMVAGSTSLNGTTAADRAGDPTGNGACGLGGGSMPIGLLNPSMLNTQHPMFIG
jgi:hypothetical protein